jgi:hypothetical protein
MKREIFLILGLDIDSANQKRAAGAYITTSKPIRIATSSSAATAGSRASGASQCYDKLARNYFSVLCLVAAVAFWL